MLRRGGGGDRSPVMKLATRSVLVWALSVVLPLGALAILAVQTVRTGIGEHFSRDITRMCPLRLTVAVLTANFDWNAET